MPQWIKWHAIAWLNSTARDELTPAERATFVDFVCLAAFPGCEDGTFKIASWPALARKLNTPLDVVEATRDKCVDSQRITLDQNAEGILITILNWARYQAYTESHQRNHDAYFNHIPKTVNTSNATFPKTVNTSTSKKREDYRRKEDTILLNVTPQETKKKAAKRREKKPTEPFEGYRDRLRLDFQDIDWDNELHKFNIYYYEEDRLPPLSPKLALWNWMTKARRDQQTRQQQRQPPGNHSAITESAFAHLRVIESGPT